MKIIARPFLYILLTISVNPPVAAGSFSNSFKNRISDPGLTRVSYLSTSIQDNSTAYKTLTARAGTTIPCLSYCTAIASDKIYENRSFPTSSNNIFFVHDDYNTGGVKPISILDLENEEWARGGSRRYV